MAIGIGAKHVATTLMISLLSSSAFAVDFLEAAPKPTKVLVENDKVRVIEATFKKDNKVPIHSHPDIVLYVIKSGKTRFTDASGKTTKSESKDGTVSFRPVTTHAHEHLADVSAIVIELKK